MNKKTYTGSKIQNHFTAYLIQFVRGKRHDYLEKKIQMADAEELLEDIGQMEARIVIEELLENQTREQLLLQEAQGKYPEWNKMSDERLMKALHTLRDEERNFQSVISGKMTPTQLRKSLGMTHSTFYRYRKTFYEKYPELSNT